jgi:hypothetical protein
MVRSFVLAAALAAAAATSLAPVRAVAPAARG